MHSMHIYLKASPLPPAPVVAHGYFIYTYSARSMHEYIDTFGSILVSFGGYIGFILGVLWVLGVLGGHLGSLGLNSIDFSSILGSF